MKKLKNIFLLLILSSSILSCKTRNSQLSTLSNMKQIRRVMPYVQNKIKKEFKLNKFNIYVYNGVNIRAMITDENFSTYCRKVNCDSVCKVIALKIKNYSKESSKNFINGYNEIVITLSKNGDHYIKGSTIDTNYKFKITDL